jgi:ketosteroid isomerase-like protein
MKHIFSFLLILIYHTAIAQDKQERAIKQVLARQAVEWNKGDIEGYMRGYWNNDSLLFVGKSGPTYGYQATLQRYKKSYADTTQMGKLHFDILQVKKLSKQYRSVLGKWTLTRSVGNLGGYFTLLFRKIDGAWVIVADHSS